MTKKSGGSIDDGMKHYYTRSDHIIIASKQSKIPLLLCCGLVRSLPLLFLCTFIMPSILKILADILERGDTAFKKLVSIYFMNNWEIHITHLFDDIKIQAELQNEEKAIEYLQKFLDWKL